MTRPDPTPVEALTKVLARVRLRLAREHDAVKRPAA
jgi:hypothetical protein